MMIEVEWRHTHFMLFPGVIWPNSLVFCKPATYAESDSSGLSVALPKYSLPACFASVCRPAVELGVVGPVDVGSDGVVPCHVRSAHSWSLRVRRREGGKGKTHRSGETLGVVWVDDRAG